MANYPIRFSTDILQRLGEELNPSIDQGILELVKNSYDADASVCTVTLKNITRGGGTIVVDDDGDGMSLDDIRDGWLVLGRSRKNVHSRTQLGRRPAGNKGLGRLAALRLGSKVIMVTNPANSGVSYSVTIDWSRYDNTDLVEQVPIEVVESPKDYSKKGTLLRIEGVNHYVGRMEVKRLARSLILLADPFDRSEASFTPRLQSVEYADLQRLVESMYFDDAEYHLQAELVDGRASAVVTDWRGGVLFRGGHQDLSTSNAGEPYTAPNATFDLWVFILTRQGFELRSSSVAEVRSWIENFGGVHLYLNGLRVAPYGNAGNDWLDMNLRRVQSPEERPGTNTSIGRVYVEDDTGILTQKTDRTGFIENAYFGELRRFAQDSLEWMARRRLDAAEARRQRECQETQQTATRVREDLARQIEKAPSELQPELQRAFKRYDRERQSEADALRREVELYRTLSTAGITAATFAHESGGYPLKLIGLSTDAIERRTREDLGEEVFERRVSKPVRSIRSATASLGVLSTATLRLVDADKRRLGRVELHASLRRIVEIFLPLLEGREVLIELNLGQGSPYMRGTESALESILTNLINNSLAALQSAPTTVRLIRITTLVEDGYCSIQFDDSGSGISGLSVKDIWLPGQTSRQGGTGLGLTIVRDAVKDLGGDVMAMPRGDLGGASFVIRLPILGVD